MTPLKWIANAVSERRQKAERETARPLWLSLRRLAVNDALWLAIGSAAGSAPARKRFAAEWETELAEAALVDIPQGVGPGTRHSANERLRGQWAKRGSLLGWLARRVAAGAATAAPAAAMAAVGGFLAWPQAFFASLGAREGWVGLAARAVASGHRFQLGGLAPKMLFMAAEMMAMAGSLFLCVAAIGIVRQMADKIGVELTAARRRKAEKRTREQVEAACREMLAHLRAKKESGAADLGWIEELDAALSQGADAFGEEEKSEERNALLREQAEAWARSKWGAVPRRLTRSQLRDLRVRRAMARALRWRGVKVVKKMWTIQTISEMDPIEFAVLILGFPALICVCARGWAAEQSRARAAIRRSKAQALRERALDFGAKQWGPTAADTAERALRARKRLDASQRRSMGLRQWAAATQDRDKERLIEIKRGKKLGANARRIRIARNFATCGLAVLVLSAGIGAASPLPWAISPQGAWGWAGWGVALSLHWLAGFGLFLAGLLGLTLSAECIKRHGETLEGIFRLIRPLLIEAFMWAAWPERAARGETEGGSRRWEALELRMAAESSKAKKDASAADGSASRVAGPSGQNERVAGSVRARRL